MNTIQKIIDNQELYRKEILKWFTVDLKKTRKSLFEIKSDDDYIKSQIEKLKKRFKKTVYKKEINKLFFFHPKRNKDFYVWWDKKEKEAIILNYVKK